MSGHDATIDAEIARTMENDKMSRAFECPSCFGIPLPPIFMCELGHFVCNQCKSELKNCVICKSSFSRSRNYFMEEMVSTSTFHCNFKENGCPEKIPGDKFQQHLDTCKFKNGKPQLEKAVKKEKEEEEQVCGEWKWIPSSKNKPIPEGAVQGGLQGPIPLYVARTSFNGGIYPGSLNAKTRQLCFPCPLGNEDHLADEYEVLVVTNLQTVKWEASSVGNLPKNLVVGGHNKYGKVVYIGRSGTANIGLFVGCVYRTGGARIPNNEIILKNNFQVLVDALGYDRVLKIN